MLMGDIETVSVCSSFRPSPSLPMFVPYLKVGEFMSYFHNSFKGPTSLLCNFLKILAKIIAMADDRVDFV